MKELDRSLGLVSVVAISMSAMLGSGIFVLPGLAAGLTGPAIWAAYLAAGLGVIPAALSKAELASAMPTSGGTYIYMDRAFGPFYGTVAGIALWLSMLLKSSFALLGFGTYLAVVADIPLRGTALALLVLITAVNILGVRKVGKAQIIVIGISLATILVIIIASIPSFEQERLFPILPKGGAGLLAATAFVFVSYNGVTKIAAIAEEVQNPSKNLPLGILLSLALAMLIYSGVSLALVGNLPLDELTGDLHPVYSLANQAIGPTAGVIAALIGVLTMTSMANAGLLAASRFPFAMSRGNLLPAVLRVIHPRFRTPVPSILMTGVAMAVAVAFVDVEKLAKLASAIIIMMYIAENAAVIVLRETTVQWYKPTYRAPFYPWIQGGGMLSGALLLASLGPSVTIAAVMIFLPGVLVFVFYGKSRVGRRGAVGKIRARAELLSGDELDADTQERQTMSILNAGHASVVVALFGKERSPETLVELGAALARGRGVHTVHCAEVPEQTLLDAVLKEEVVVQSLRRRLEAMATKENIRLDFHAMVSRDLLRTIHGITSRTHCRWLVMEWRGQSRSALLPRNPIGWLINHLDSNLATFKDAGIRYVRRILVRAEPGPHDALVIGTAEHLAELWHAETTIVRFVPDSASDSELERKREYLEELGRIYEGQCTTLVLRGEKEVQAMAQLSTAHDLLVMSSPDVTLAGMLRGTVEERIRQRSACSVLTVRTPRMRTHEALANRKSSVPSGPIRLGNYLVRDAVVAKATIGKKEALFQYIAKVFAEAIPETTAKEVFDALQARERAQNTSVGHGVAIPHATLPSASRSYLGVFTTKTPIDYQGPDGKRVDVFFVTLGPPKAREAHLQLLSTISQSLLQSKLLTALRAADNPREIEEAIELCQLS